ncbi:MAG: VOC family protein [Thiobacillaceae bacterium]
MTRTVGRFVWYDLMTTDIDAAATFYGGVIGWKTADAGMSERRYGLFSAGAVTVGGLMPLPENLRAEGVPPSWTGYIGVDDVDAYAVRVSAAGGTVRRGPEDIPGVGRFAVVADPYGAVFILFKGSSDEAPADVAPMTPGHIGWHELHAGDPEGAFDFYSGLFGWTKEETHDMGPMGVYQTFATGGLAVGGMMTREAQTPASFWLYYFNVDSVDAALARVRNGKGQVLNGPQQVPGDVWIAQCLDPQGAMFAIVGAK